MNCVPSWRTRGARSCAPESRRFAIAALVLPLIAFTSCAGLFQRSMPDVIASYARITTGEVRAGFAESDITPDGVQYLGGFSLNKPSTGVHSPLKARAVVLIIGGRRIAIVGVDNLGLLREDVEWIKQSLTGFANGDVFICSSHTHAGPDLIGLWGFYFLTSGRDTDYLRVVRRGIRDAVSAAEKNARPATLWQGQDRLTPEVLVDNSNRRGVYNRRVTVLEARAKSDGKPLGSLLHFACHPEMMRRNNTLVSSDMVGALCDRWRAAGHGQAVFVNGELGAMVTPRYRPHGAKGIPVVGGKLLVICERALAAAHELKAPGVEVRRRDVYLPLKTPGLVVGRLSGAIRRELYGGNLRTSVGYLRIGTFEAVSVPGEMEPVLAGEIRRALGKPDLLVFGLVDDEVGYIMRGVDAVDPEFAYERTMSPSRDSGELLRAAIVGR
jgi:hypothetical protein